MHVKYRLHNISNSGVLLNSKKKLTCSTTYHLVSSVYEEFNKSKESFVGKIRADSQKRVFHAYDNGKRAHCTSDENSKTRRELCAIVHKKQSNKKICYKKFDWIIPFIDESGEQHCPTSKDDKSSLSYQYETNSENIVFQTEEPKWSDETQEYILQFDSQIDKPSVKSFKLKHKSGMPECADESSVFLEFGKVNEDKYQMTLRWPFSIFTAFSVAISAIEAPVIN